MALTLITGNTYPVRTSLKELGGTWDPDERGWHVPAECAEEARAIIAHYDQTFVRRHALPVPVPGAPPVPFCPICHGRVPDEGEAPPRPRYPSKMSSSDGCYATHHAHRRHSPR
jgi:hypothetical protein